MDAYPAAELSLIPVCRLRDGWTVDEIRLLMRPRVKSVLPMIARWMLDWAWEKKATVSSKSPCEWLGPERGSRFAEDEVRLGRSGVLQVGLRGAEELRALDEPGAAKQRRELVGVSRPRGRGSMVEGVGRRGPRRFQSLERPATRAHDPCGPQPPHHGGTRAGKPSA